MNNILEKLIKTNLFDAENQYLKLYVELIISNLNQEKIKFKTQEHHIIPKSYNLLHIIFLSYVIT